MFLNSYQNGYAWSDDILDGVRNLFMQSGLLVDLQIEYMDTKRYRPRDVEDVLHTYFQSKFSDAHFDVVIGSDNTALTFLLKYRDELFPGTPVVFCGVNDFNPNVLNGRSGFTGIVENPDVTASLNLALDLNPTLKNVVVVGDYSVTSHAITNQVRQQAEAFKDRIHFQYWESLPLAEILHRTQSLGPDTALFFTPFYKGAHGELYTAEEVLSAIRDNANVMIFSSWRFLLGHGIVGGKLLSGHEMGKAAATMAVRILKGESADSIPLQHFLESPFMFDYLMLEKFGISVDALPEGSEIINEPDLFYRIEPKLFWTIVASLALLSLILVLLAFNVLRRRRVERVITAQLAFQEILMDTLPLLICWKDKSQRYLGANKSFTDFFELRSPDKILGELDRDLLADPELIRRLEEWDREVLDSGRPVLGQNLRVFSRDNEMVWLDINKVPLHDEKGKVVGTLSTAEDVTRKVNLERQLLQSQKMEAIGTLAGGIAHDFNNILTSIINSTELAISDVEEDSMTHKDLARVLKAADRGSRVVKQILAFSRPSQEGFILTDIAEAVHEAVELMKASMPRNIEIRTDIAESDWRIWADPTQIQQVIMNLCTNSFQALRPTGGILALGLSRTVVEGDKDELLNIPPGVYLRISICDNGPGIPLEIVDKIFDPFFTTKGKTEGTGLGLAVVHGIAQAHCGGVRVSSIPWERTCFEIYLPCTKGKVLLADACGGDARRGAEHILFVEDDQDQLETVPRLLEKLGYTVTALRDPAEALERLRTAPEKYDLLITDYDMPGTNGLQLARKAVRIAPELPVIMVSGRKDALAEAAASEFVQSTLTKPYNQATLSEVIRLTLDKFRVEQTWPES